MKKLINFISLLTLIIFLAASCTFIKKPEISGTGSTSPDNTSSADLQSTPASSAAFLTSSETANNVAAASSKPDNSPIIKNDAAGIPDEVLYKVILAELNKKPDGAFTENEAESIVFLSYGFQKDKIKDITGIDKLKNLTALHITDNEITDFTPVLNLKKLKTLNLSSNKISDISAAAQLKWLVTINFSYNIISGLTPLADLQNLKELNLWHNNIKDVTPLTNLKNLEVLNLESNYLNMSDNTTINNVNLLRNKIKYFSLGL